MARAKSLTAIAEWAADAPPAILFRLSGPCREPDRGPVAADEAAARRTLQRIDGNALDTAVDSWLARREDTTAGEAEENDRPPPPWQQTARPCVVPAASTAPKSTCSPR